ncbi:EAL domain-containing protein [Sulfurospirillum barnesii]|uniref:Diguanylate cyclase (GGDEF) domain-containing protein n=1 Tax=Sulfurospirillum barnesii (strain ATCC 700032 / DSM 10660 / SES-3) TaxID=760154 RepID=I3XUQ5_SULBS|nr:bifunctional diguanylate cyclase/phosphodiesterase [Sulfurospirillum barnesii]AFL67679.1 diguanylate cyclase (GGDEF) domain-containing protein [Sulfurospirillum barnesii SES-3]
MQEHAYKELSASEKIHLLTRELELVQQNLVDQFYTDPLTRLPNLYKLRHDLEEENDFTFVLANIDNFKLLNDFYGFVVGDFILESFAKSLKESLQGASVYRIAGDEFAILIKNRMDFYYLKEYLEELSKTFNHLKYAYAQTEIYVDCTLSSSASTSHHDIFSKVNMALKYAKKHQLKYWIYEDRMNFTQEYERNLKYATKVRKAIVECSGIVPYFQPIIDNQTNEIVKYEALSRLVDEKGMIHNPNHFIPIAKTIKVYDKITMTVIEKSFEIFKEHPFDFSINLSFEDIINEAMYDFIIHKLSTSKMGHRVTFELLESEKVQDFNKVKHFFHEIKRYGVKVAIDDFGSGFSNFSYVIKLKPDFIKIDGSLIKEIDRDKNAQIVVETIVDFSKKLGIKTVAEFVHSSTVLSMVKQLGIDYSQGYYIDMPSPILSTH